MVQDKVETSIGIVAKNRSKVAATLSKLLADEFILATKTRNAHWNVEGIDFHDKHLFFEAQYNAIDQFIDDIAERIRMLGHYAPATLGEYLGLTHLAEQPVQQNASIDYIRELLRDHESLIIEFRKQIDRVADELQDAGTSDFITGLMEQHEKMAWMLRAHFRPKV